MAKPRPVFCVLRTGGFGYTTQGGSKRSVEYTPENVIWLRNQIDKFYPDTPFYCLSDVEVPGVETIPLQFNWPGWWAKMELFRYGPLLYLDLDTVITAPLTDILEAKHTFTICSKFSKDAGLFNSSVMAWDVPLIGLYETFLRSPQAWMKLYQGDQDFLSEQILEYDTFQSRFPGSVESYKKLKKTPTPIVCFNGFPKPHQVDKPWMP